MPTPSKSRAGLANFSGEAVPPRVYARRVAKLTRMISAGTTLFFTMPGGKKSQRARNTFLKPQDVPEFEGDEGWFEVEKVEGWPWPYWRAIRQVEPPADART